MSRIGEEWVSPPTDRKSTPVPRSRRDLERQAARGLDLDRLACRAQQPTVSRSTSMDMLSHKMKRAPASYGLLRLGRRRHLDLDGDVGEALAHERRMPRRPTRGELVVVLDHRDVVEAHALVGAPAAAHGVLLERAQARRRLAGVEDHRARPVERVGPAPGVRGHAGEPAQDVEHGALGDEDDLGRAGEPWR